MAEFATEIIGIDLLLRDLRTMERQVEEWATASSADIAKDVASLAASKARSGSAQLAAIAGTIHADGEAVVAGGSSTVTSSGASGGEIYFGADFGSSYLKRFPDVKRGGRTIFPAVRELGDQIEAAYLDPIEDHWG